MGTEKFPSDAKSIRCKCPRCGNYHDRLLFWTGRGVPRYFCDDCNMQTDRLGFKHDPGIPVHQARIPRDHVGVTRSVF